MKGRLTGAMLLLEMFLLVLLTGCGNLSPIASFTCTPSSGHSPLTVSFDASASYDPDGSIVSYQWTFGDGTNGTGVTISHTYTTTINRTYSVTLTVTDDNGAQATDTHTVSVTPPPPNSPPVASFTRTPSSGEAPLRVLFNASGSYDPDGSITSYVWDFGDGGSGSGVTTTHTYTSAGTYTARLTVTDNDGGIDTVTHSITVTAAPQVEYRVTAGQLLDEYDANEVAAQSKYGNKLIAVSGYVDSVNINDFTGEPYVLLVGSPGDWALCAVRCTFPISAQATLATLSKGDYVTIIGTCKRYLLCDVMIDDCYFE